MSDEPLSLRFPPTTPAHIGLPLARFMGILAVLFLTPALGWGQTPGGRIAFTRVREDVRIPGDYRFEAEIWVMDSVGATPRRLTHNTSDDFGVAWSPDGKSLVFGATQFGHDANRTVVPLTQHLYTVNPDGGAPVMLTPGNMRAQFPSWSPDGSTIVFHGGYGGVGDELEIFLIAPDGTDLRRLTSNAWADMRPDWSPDGRKLAFQSNRDGSAEIFVMNADGSDVVQLTKSDSGVMNRAPDWSPDGKQILFVSNRDGNLEIYVMNADGTNITRVTNDPGEDADPEWTPDGRIVFDSRIPVDGRLVEQLHITNVDGTNVVAITGAPSSNSHAAWSRR